ncbi:MAG: oxygenase MpaB family protein [Actinomycetota bacterium]
MSERLLTGDAARIATEARRRVAAVRDDPEDRYRLVESFYDEHPVPGPDWYGRSELDFMRWEIERGVLNSPQDRTQRGSPWWRMVNEAIIRDAIEAGMLVDARITDSPVPAVARWMDFLTAPSAASWYRAHNASVIRGYVKAALLARRERPAEQFLMNLVLARVLFAGALAEGAAFAIGDHRLLSRLLADPRLPAVRLAMDVPDFYPRSYPLDAGEEEILERRARSADDDALAAIDAEPCAHIDELFAYAAKRLDAPELGRFIDRGLICYPHGLLVDPDAAGPRLWLPWLAEQRDLHPSRWTDELLDKMRHIADRDVDEVVARYFEESGAGAHEFFQQLVRTPEPLPEECSPAVAEYLNEKPPLPRWADAGLMAAGEEFFGEWGLYVPLVLICSSLPECYGAAKGVQVLHLTARLATDARRRVIETAQMVLDVMSPGGMAIDGPGYRTVRRVRLMHAGVRYLIQNDPRVNRSGDAGPGPRWDPDWGVPINQEDLAGTLTTFSWTVLTGLRLIGVPVTKEQEEAYLHAWNVVGAMMGIKEELIPKDAADADALATAIRARQWKESIEGVEMTRALLDMLEGSGPARVVPGFGPAMIRHFIGDELADTLAVPRTTRTAGIVRRLSVAAFAAGMTQQRSRLARAMAGRVSRGLLRAYADFDRGGERPSFEIPTALAETWKVRR